MANIADLSMEAYKKRVRDDTGLGLMQPTIPATATFELKGHILTALKEVPFPGKDHEDAYKHLDEVNEIAGYFNIPNVPRETVLLRILPVTFKGAAKDWLKALPPGAVTTWARMHELFLEQFCPPSKVAKLKKAISNFEQQLGESLYEAWECYKGLIRNCPQNDLNVQQEVSIFYDRVNVTTHQLLDSQGPLTKKNPAEIKQLIEEFSKHSREYHNPWNDVTRGSENAASEDMLAVMAMLQSMDRRMTKMDQTIHVIRVGCENCNGPHLTKECDLDESGNRKVQACYSSGDRLDEDWRKPKKWLPYDEYKKAKEEKYEQRGRGIYQREEPTVEKKSDFESMLTRFAAVSEQRHEVTEVTIKEKQLAIKEQQLMMKEQKDMMKNQQALLRNQQASILNIEKQLGQLATQFNERALGGLLGNTEQNPRGAHIQAITTRSGKIITHLTPIERNEPEAEQEG
ncbi:uncharacterized protein LOC111889173 [Lactuca sativa]|uniref:uncharacterized protein LOC111889173 n=1 Tax=Lactuca sativa TaxID=4236 RepID=UPI000CD7EA6E|nr:uncharacterized protein LOC111889173 [Lactuca sativa]